MSSVLLKLLQISSPPSLACQHSSPNYSKECAATEVDKIKITMCKSRQKAGYTMRSFLSSSRSSILCLSTGSNALPSPTTFSASSKSFLRLNSCFYINRTFYICDSIEFQSCSSRDDLFACLPLSCQGRPPSLPVWSLLLSLVCQGQPSLLLTSPWISQVCSLHSWYSEISLTTIRLLKHNSIT